MKRITVSLPDELVDKIKQAAGCEGHVSSYVATALADYQEQESLDELLVVWGAELPVPDEVQQHVVDVHVALCARDRRHALVTIDPDDFARIDPMLQLIRL